MFIYTYKNIERQEGKESGSIQIKPKHQLVIKFHLIKVSKLNLGPSQLFVTGPMHSKTCIGPADHILNNQRL